jgi:Glyoxalase-like domain
VKTDVDHLVVAAESLAQGVAWCEATFGITPGPGGKHPLMGTHNRLFSIAGPAWPVAYFEIIAIDPEAPAPGRRRWYGLDEPALQARLAQAPRLVHWVARTAALDMHRWGLVNLGLDPGLPLAVSRDTPQGTLAWQLLVRDDGALLAGGALPTLIQWQGRHPSKHLPASGVTLRGLQLGGLATPVRRLLATAGVTHAEAPAMRAVLATPKGDVTLETS